ncbi:MAG: hypothetical protein AB1757_12220 [Acidobacteriota bacterium]
MICPKCRTQTTIGALSCPSCKLKTPRGRLEAELAEEKKASEKSRFDKSISGGAKKLSISPLVSTLIIVASVSICALGAYLSFTYFGDPPKPAERIPHQEVLERLQSQTANNSYLTVDEALNNEVEKSRKAENLMESEGWNVEAIEGGFSITFSFQEKDKQQKAVWLFNAFENTYKPQTDLANFVYKP